MWDNVYRNNNVYINNLKGYLINLNSVYFRTVTKQ